MAVKFNVVYSKEKDIQVYLNAIWKPIWVDYGTSKYELSKKYLPIEFLDSLRDAPDKAAAIKVIKDYWQTIRVPNFEENTKFIIKWFSRILNEDQDFIINKLEKTYQRKFPFSDITVYLTTFISCPYNYDQKWYMINRTNNLFGLTGISTHELNHFMFYYYFADKLKNDGYNYKQIEYLKEALAVLTTNNLMENQDKPSVLPIQNFIKENKDKSIDKIIELVIKNKLLEKIK